MPNNEDNALIIIENDNYFKIDKKKVNEERRAYLEEARSQET